MSAKGGGLDANFQAAVDTDCLGGGSSFTTEELHCLWHVALELVPAVRKRTTQGLGAQRHDNLQFLSRKVDQRPSVVPVEFGSFLVLRPWLQTSPLRGLPGQLLGDGILGPGIAACSSV